MEIPDKFSVKTIKRYFGKGSKRLNNLFSRKHTGNVLFGFFLSGWIGHILFSSMGRTAGWTFGLLGSLMLNVFWREAEKWAENLVDEAKDKVEDASG